MYALWRPSDANILQGRLDFPVEEGQGVRANAQRANSQGKSVERVCIYR